MVFCRECGKRLDILKKTDRGKTCKDCEFDEYQDDVVDKLASGNFKQEHYDPFYDVKEVDWQHLD